MDHVVSDMVNAPQHYRGHASGVECIEITEHMSFCAGNALKYVYRRNDKWDSLEDLRKAAWYLRRHITSEAAPVWVWPASSGKAKLWQVIEHEHAGDVRAFYDALFVGNPHRALDALERELARIAEEVAS